MTKPLTKEMTKPRVAGLLGGAVKAWWYINPESIDVCAESQRGGTTHVRLSKRQLERALEVMKSY